MKAFDEDTITQELEAGPEALSQIPGLAHAGGNLYSFLGFNAGEEPTQAIREYFEEGITLGKTRAGVPHGDQVTFKTPVKFPTVADVDKVAGSNNPLDWIARPWTDLLSRGEGIPGLPNYLFDLVKNFPNSRSGPAVQATKSLRAGDLGQVPYISRLLGVLKALLSQNKR